MSKLMKWSGSKDSQAIEIVSYIPKDTINYYEPFVGGGSIFLNLIENSNIKNFFISDYNKDLINIYKSIQNDPLGLIVNYEQHYSNFNSGDIQHRKDYFKEMRIKYNNEHNPFDFYWIMRTTTNGMPRYNKKSEFNNSCHFSRPGMNPEKVKELILKYHDLFNEKNIIFKTSNYLDIEIKNGFLYCDPPYENTKGMYFSNFNNKEFINWINNQDKWLLSYDGKVNDKEINHQAPKYKNHIYLNSGNSSFRRVIGNSNDSIVKESLYMNF